MHLRPPHPTPPRRRLFVGSLAVLAGVLGSVTAGHATSFVRPSDAELLAQADAVVEARVLEARPTMVGAWPGVDYRLLVEYAVKGLVTGSEITVRLPGGVRPDGRGLRLVGMPAFEPGARGLFFLSARSADVYGVVEQMLGTFAIGDDGVVHRPLDGAVAVQLAGRQPAADGPRDLEAFRSWLDDRTHGEVRPADYFLPAAVSALPNKFRLFDSPTLPPPLGCGALGGHNIRSFAFENGGSVAWTRYGEQPALTDDGGAAFATALAAWNDTSLTIVQLVDGGTVSTPGDGQTAQDGRNTLLWGDPNDEIPGSFTGTGLLALGGAWFDCETDTFSELDFHPILEGDIVIQDGVSALFTASSAPEAAAAELIAHEIGHTLGLGHSSDAEALMFATLHDDGRGASLTPDDENAVALLYPFDDPGPSNPVPPSAPEAPTAFDAQLIAGIRVHLTWQHPDSAAGIRVERQRDDGPFELVDTVGGVTIYNDGSTLGGTSYGYRLRAFNPFGASLATQVITVTTVDTTDSAAPTNLRLAPTSPSSLHLSWQDNSDDELFFAIELDQGGTWTQVAVASADQTTLMLDGLDADTQYALRVRAEAITGSTSPSNVASVSTFSTDVACTSDDETLCLLGGRYAVSVRYRNQYGGGTEGTGQVIPSTNKTGLVWFFNARNIELIVKILDGTGANGHAWVFYGGLSDVEYWVEVLDTETGERKTYYNPPGIICGQADVTAFDTPIPPQPTTEAPLPPGPTESPAIATTPTANATAPTGILGSSGPITTGTGSGSTSTCTPGPEALCLADGRFRVEVAYRNQHAGGTAGIAQAIVGTDNTGYLWFFDLANTELVVKILDGRPINDHFWVFYGALTDVEFTVTITDTVLDTTKIYANSAGEICGQADSQAFYAPENGSGGPGDPIDP